MNTQRRNSVLLRCLLSSFTNCCWWSVGCILFTTEYGGGRVRDGRSFCNLLSRSWFSAPNFPVARVSLSQFLPATLWMGFWMWLSCSRVPAATMLLWSALLSSKGGGWSCALTLPMGLPDLWRLLMNQSSKVVAVSTQTTIKVPTSRGSRWSVQLGGRMSMCWVAWFFHLAAQCPSWY